MIKFDFWYGDSEKEIAFADCFFYPNSGSYAGNIYNKGRTPTGDEPSAAADQTAGKLEAGEAATNFKFI